MNPETYKEVQSLERMTVGELKEKYLDVFGEETRSNNKPFLKKRIAWRIQALAGGDLSERARKRAKELARDADLRMRAPRDPVKPGSAEARARSVKSRLSSAHDPRVPPRRAPSPRIQRAGHRGPGAGRGFRVRGSPISRSRHCPRSDRRQMERLRLFGLNNTTQKNKGRK